MLVFTLAVCVSEVSLGYICQNDLDLFEFCDGGAIFMRFWRVCLHVVTLLLRRMHSFALGADRLVLNWSCFDRFFAGIAWCVWNMRYDIDMCCLFWRRRRSQDHVVFCLFVCYLKVTVSLTTTFNCSAVFCCFYSSRVVAKKWLGRCNITIAIDSITREKSE